jgi:hypothetical protein
MCDLGASINVMPLSIFTSLNVGPLKETGVVIQLADRSIVHPEGVLEDVLLQVKNLIFPVDFYILDMEDDKSSNSSDVLLGRPFLSTAKAEIDMHNGILTMEFDGEQIKFNMYDAMKFPGEVFNVSIVDIVDPFAQEIFELHDDDELNVILCRFLSKNKLGELLQIFKLDDKIVQLVQQMEILNPSKTPAVRLELPNPNDKRLPSVVQAPILELELLPNYLKYGFLGVGETLPVIVSNKLST